MRQSTAASAEGQHPHNSGRGLCQPNLQRAGAAAGSSYRRISVPETVTAMQGLDDALITIKGLDTRQRVVLVRKLTGMSRAVR